MEGVPAEVDLTLLENALKAIPDVTAVHDVHVWTITSGLDAMSGHVVIGEGIDSNAVLRAANAMLEDQFHLQHVTIQIEDQRYLQEESRLPV